MEKSRQQQATDQPRHRLKMLFPLLLRIATRLAQIVPMALAAMTATFVMTLLAKKAFLVSLAAFALMVYESLKKKDERSHYYLEPKDEHHLIFDNHYASSDSQTHKDNSYMYGNQWKKYGGQNDHRGSGSNIVQRIKPPHNHFIPIRGNHVVTAQNRYSIDNDYIQYIEPY